VTNTYAHISATFRPVKKAAFFVLVAAVFAGISASVLACGERCQVNDPRSECNAYGAPDKYKDANIVTSSDASAE
jgi:hypothetical protein